MCNAVQYKLYIYKCTYNTIELEAIVKDNFYSFLQLYEAFGS